MTKSVYDKENDIINIYMTSKKPYYSMELSNNVILDFSVTKIPIGIELLDASKVLSKLFKRKIEKKELENIHCIINHDDEIYAQFKIKNEEAKLLIPSSYESPVVRT